LLEHNAQDALRNEPDRNEAFFQNRANPTPKAKGHQLLAHQCNSDATRLKPIWAGGILSRVGFLISSRRDGASLAGGQRGFARATTGFDVGSMSFPARPAPRWGAGRAGKETDSHPVPVVAPKASQPTG